MKIPDEVLPFLSDLKSDNVIAVGLSGGIDSAVAAALLKSAGCDVIGLSMRIWPEASTASHTGRTACFGPGEAADLALAQSVAERLGIAYHVVLLEEEYRREVLDYTRNEYLQGRTPNPCVRCNARVKIGLLLERASALGLHFDRFATGHYARRLWDPGRGRYRLLRGVDCSKDQSYFLAQLSQQQLAQLILPLGYLTKNRVRALASEAGWEDLLARKESQDFIENGNWSLLFDQEARIAPGDIVDCDGRVLGQHRGLVHYTIGQRKGLGIGGAGEPWYVVGLDVASNRVIVGRRSEAFSRGLEASRLNWLGLAQPPAQVFRCLCQLRISHTAAPATVRILDEDKLEVIFDTPQFAIAPGQLAALYDGEELLGAGLIDKSIAV
ncbi:MAG: tRNA 2-thiouridine(34) synthase MnmA [Kiritimatiellia bacterium]